MDFINNRKLGIGRFVLNTYGELTQFKYYNKKKVDSISFIKAKVLIIDEEWNILKLLYSVLESQYEIITKNSPFSALQWIEAGNIPSLIICEYKLTHFENAFFVQQLRNSGFHKIIPIIILSDTEDLQNKINLLPFKVNCVLSKPFNPINLKTIIQNVLNEFAT